MSDTETDQTDAPADQITDFTDLYSRQTGLNRFTILNLAADDPTAYHVNTADLSCQCRDEEFNRSEGETCKHLAYALYTAPKEQHVDTWMVDQASQAIQDVHNAVQHLSNGHADPSASTDTESAEDGSQPPEVAETMDQDQLPEDGEEQVKSWLGTNTPAPELVDVSRGHHNDQIGIQLEPDNQSMSDGQYESFKAVVNNLDGSEVHVGFGDDPCHSCGEDDGEFYYFLPAHTLEELD